MVVPASSTLLQLSKLWNRPVTDILMVAQRLGIPGAHVHFKFNAPTIVTLANEFGIVCDVVAALEDDTDLNYPSKDAAFEDGWTKGQSRGRNEGREQIRTDIQVMMRIIKTFGRFLDKVNDLPADLEEVKKLIRNL